MHRWIFRTGVIVSLLLEIGWAQPRFQYPTRYVNFSTGMWYRHWTIRHQAQDYHVSELLFPLQVMSPITDRLNLSFSTSQATAILNQTSRNSLAGLADGKIKAYYELMEHHLLLNVGCSLPYGKNRFTQTEIDVAEWLHENILGFGLKRFGEGFDVDAGLAGAFQVGSYFTLGMGAGYVVKGEYEFFHQSDYKVKPGNEFSLNLGADFEKDSVFVRGDFLFKAYGADKYNATPFLKQGEQFECYGLFAVRSYPIRFVLSLRNIIKQDNALKGTVTRYLLEGQNFIDNSFWSQANLYYVRSNRLAFFGKVNFNKFGQSDLQLGDAWIMGSGLGLNYKFSEPFMTTLEWQYLNGAALNGDMTLRGWDANLMVMFNF